MGQTVLLPRPHGMALLIADIDRFMDINDSYGHVAGDQVLKVWVSRLRTACRRKERFTLGWRRIFYFAVTPARGGSRQKLCAAIPKNAVSAETKWSKLQFKVGGLAVKDITGMQVGEFARRANRCLHRAKEARQNCLQMELVECLLSTREV